MRIIIYESSSSGGIFDYGVTLLNYFSKNSSVDSVELIVPSSTEIGTTTSSIKKILLSDKVKFRLFSRVKFLFRHFINPLIFFIYLIRLGRARKFIIFNDFEQLSSFIWVILFKLFFKNHLFAIYLHDPDRDLYPPSKKISEVSMRLIMSLMNFAFYHEKLPVKKYYNLTSRTRYIKVPFGYYSKTEIDTKLSMELSNNKVNTKFITILGNIRSEKNYELAIRLLQKFENIKLLIAGSPSTSSPIVSDLIILAKDLGVENRIIWIVKYLTESEMASVIEATDLILLNYKSSFKSQSAILNSIAAYKKQILVSRTESALTYIVDYYKIGVLVKPDNFDDLLKKLPEALSYNNDVSWDNYLLYASWENHVTIVLNEFKNCIQ